ncbi:MAG: efflux transporter periplasmic adaptor subunit, partial [bacterium]
GGEVLSIPREALVGSVKNPQVFIVENNIARHRTLVVGEVFGNSISVLQGLKAGETIVTNGQNNLQDSVTVEVIR